MSSERCSE